MDHELLRSRVEEACNKIATYGIEGCEDKEVTLACFGLLMFNGIESLRKAFNRAVWMLVSIGLSAMIAIVLALLFA